jgi:hypothetical protein
MAQHDQVIDNAPGLAVRTDLNAAVAALFTSSSGTVEPAVKTPGQLWFDTSSPAVMRVAVRDQTNATWDNLMLASGGTMTGALTLTKPFVAAGDEALTLAPSTGPAVLKLTTPAAGAGNYVTAYVGGNARWSIVLGNSTAETGSNVGSDFQLNRFSDTGAVIDSPLIINRKTGVVYFPIPPLISASAFIASAGSDASLTFRDEGSTNRAALIWQHATGALIGYNYIGSGTFTMDQVGGFYVSGAAYKPSGGSWTASSDARIKTVQGDYSQGLTDVLALHPVIYTYKGNDTPTADRDAEHMDIKSAPDGPATASPHYAPARDQTAYVGLIAQEVETIFPDMVTQRAGFIDGAPVTDLRELDTSPLIYALVNAVKTLSARIEALEAVAGA